MSAVRMVGVRVDALTLEERFAVCTARVYRAFRAHEPTGGTCLCRLFRAAGIRTALPAFVQFQSVLAADPAHTIVYEERGSSVVGAGELLMLSAIARWQRQPDADPASALPFISVGAVRSRAAPSGRLFAVEMAAAGLFLPQRTAAAAWWVGYSQGQALH